MAAGKTAGYKRQEMKDELFDRKIKELVDSCSETPDTDLWDRIESDLNRRRRMTLRRRVLYYSAAAAAVAVGVFTAVRFNDGMETVPENTIAVVTEPAPEQEIVQLVRTSHGRIISSRPETHVVSTADAGTVYGLLRRVIPVPGNGSGHEQETVVREPVRETPSAVSTVPSIYDYSPSFEYLAMAGTSDAERERKRPSFSIAASGLMSPTDAAGNVDFSQPSYTWGATGQSGMSGIVPVYDIRHYFPVSVGLELKYSFLNDRLGVGLGFNYTFLISDYEALVNASADNRYQGSVHQSIHYIGVPLNFYVNILSGDKLSFYANAGCMVERAVRMTCDITDLYGSKYRKSFDPHGVQWSANIGLGLEYRFLDFLGLYVDPRLTYFFDCGQPYSVRTEQPLQFNLELGLRFHI